MTVVFKIQGFYLLEIKSNSLNENSQYDILPWYILTIVDVITATFGYGLGASHKDLFSVSTKTVACLSHNVTLNAFLLVIFN